jgi:competence protein ComEC
MTTFERIRAGAGQRYVTDASAIALAVATWAGVVIARPVPVVAGAAVVGLALAGRRSWLLVLGGGLLGSGLAANAWAGLVPATAAPYEGPVRLVEDPGELGTAVVADVALADGRRLEAWARGPTAVAMRSLLAGETVVVRGALAPPPAGADWLAPRHVVGRLTITSVTADVDPGPAWDRLANDYHRLLATGAEALPAEQRPLLLGFVLGDDRGEDPAVVSDFRDAGLSHLLVVSGENVAFVLALVAPIVGRLRLSARLVVTLVVLAWFALLTRFEPSVLRATVMAGVAAVASYRGRQLSGVRVLALAVALLLVVDPLLQGALGFRLSVAASAAIIGLAPPLARQLPGPTAIRQAFAVALAAQLGVAPVLVPAFGGIPAPSIAANLLAVPAAGPVMMWGLVAGPVAGVLRSVGAAGAAAALLVPIHWLLAWVAGVAQVAAAAPLGSLGPAHVAALVVAVAAFVLAGRRRRVAGQGAAAGLFVAVLLLPALTAAPLSDGQRAVAPGVQVWRAAGGASATVVLAVSGAATRPDAALDGLRQLDVRELDVVVVTSTSRQARAAVDTIRSRLDVALVWQPAGAHVDGARTPSIGDHLDLGGIGLTVRAVRPSLDVDVRIAPGPV